MKIYRTWITMSRGTRFQILFYTLILIMGIGVFFIPTITENDTSKDLLFSLGIAFVAASILGFAQRLFFYDDFRSEMDGLVSHSLEKFLSKNMLPFIEQGVNKLHTDRQTAINELTKYIKIEEDKIIIIGSSLKGLLDPTENNKVKKEFAELIKEKYKTTNINFLLTHPTLAFLREGAEGRSSGKINSEIIRTLKYLTGHGFNEKGVEPLNINYKDIKLYHGTPTIFTIITSQKLLLNPYTYMGTAFENFCFELDNKGDKSLYSRIVTAHYERPWDNGETVTQLTEEVMDNLDKINLFDLFTDIKNVLAPVNMDKK